MPGSKEFFTIVDGKISDAELHEEILAGGDHTAVIPNGRAQAKKAGLTKEELDLLYGTATASDPKSRRRSADSTDILKFMRVLNSGSFELQDCRRNAARYFLKPFSAASYFTHNERSFRWW